VTVILLIVGHRPVFQTGPAMSYFALRKQLRATFPDSPNTTTACISVTPCGWSIFAIAFRASPEEPSPGTARCPGQKRDRRELNMRGLELTGRPGAVR